MNAATGLRLHIQDQAASVILNRPEKRNALSRALLAELTQTFSDLHQERRVRSVILTGAGDAFCAGMDLQEIYATASGPQPHAQWQADSVQLSELIEQILRFPKPVIAAVNGAALGAGAALVLAADIAIGSENLQLGFPEPRRGLVAGIAAPLLAFRAGGSAAGYLLIGGRSVDAEGALRLGLVQEVVDADHLWPRATQLANDCHASAPESLQLTKRLLNETIGEQLTALLSAGAAAMATARTTEAAAEGVRAFTEKRSPEWP